MCFGRNPFWKIVVDDGRNDIPDYGLPPASVSVRGAPPPRPRRSSSVSYSQRQSGLTITTQTRSSGLLSEGSDDFYTKKASPRSPGRRLNSGAPPPPPPWAADRVLRAPEPARALPWRGESRRRASVSHSARRGGRDGNDDHFPSAALPRLPKSGPKAPSGGASVVSHDSSRSGSVRSNNNHAKHPARASAPSAPITSGRSSSRDVHTGRRERVSSASVPTHV